MCSDCGHVAYHNPKVMVGSVVQVGDTVLLCRRAIEPRRGYWTLPAGYLEHGETVEEGAMREAARKRAPTSALTGSSYSHRRRNSVKSARISQRSTRSPLVIAIAC